MNMVKEVLTPAIELGLIEEPAMLGEDLASSIRKSSFNCRGSEVLYKYAHHDHTGILTIKVSKQRLVVNYPDEGENQGVAYDYSRSALIAMVRGKIRLERSAGLLPKGEGPKIMKKATKLVRAIQNSRSRVALA